MVGTLMRRPPFGSEPVVLAGTAARPLAGDDHATLEDLAAPHSPRLPTLDGAGEAGEAGRAVPAQVLGPLQIGRRLGEPEIGVLHAAGDVVRALLGQRVERVEPERAVEPSGRAQIVGSSVAQVVNTSGHLLVDCSRSVCGGGW